MDVINDAAGGDSVSVSSKITKDMLLGDNHTPSDVFIGQTVIEIMENFTYLQQPGCSDNERSAAD